MDDFSNSGDNTEQQKYFSKTCFSVTKFIIETTMSFPMLQSADLLLLHFTEAAIYEPNRRLQEPWKYLKTCFSVTQFIIETMSFLIPMLQSADLTSFSCHYCSAGLHLTAHREAAILDSGLQETLTLGVITRSGHAPGALCQLKSFVLVYIV